MRRILEYGLVAAAAIAIVLMLACCSKIDERVREERIPLPQGQVDPPDPDWNNPSDIDGKHIKPQ